MSRPSLTPDAFEILVTRELRKIGFALDRPRRLGLERLRDGEGEYALELDVLLGAPGGEPLRALVSCRNADDAVDEPGLAGVVGRIGELEATAGLLFATGGFRAAAVRAATRHPLALFRVSDGRTVFDTGGWGAPGHYPAWLPEHLAELASPGAGLEPRYEMTTQGLAPRVLELLRS